ncbi:MAG: hypothetical protein AB1801_09370, partial [Chloroflexota bacterium]
MKRLFAALILVMLVSLNTGPAVLADHSVPIGGCPEPFDELHHAYLHDLHHEGHIGTDADQNGDGYICVKHISPHKHLHIDNNK